MSIYSSFSFGRAVLKCSFDVMQTIIKEDHSARSASRTRQLP